MSRRGKLASGSWSSWSPLSQARGGGHLLGPYPGLTSPASPHHLDCDMPSQRASCQGSWFLVVGGEGLTQVKVPGMRAALHRLECAAYLPLSPRLCLGSGFKIRSFPQVKLAEREPGALSRTIKKQKQRKYHCKHY